MNYELKLQGFEGQRIEVRSPGIFSGYKLLVNDEKVPKGPKRGQLLLRRNDGIEIIASLKPKILGLDVPQLLIDGKTYNLVEPLLWYELMWSGLPIFLVFTGGALGGALGALAFSVNARVFRAPLNPIVKFATTTGVSFLAVMVFLIIALMIFGSGEE
jgi:hypothetical protein